MMVKHDTVTHLTLEDMLDGVIDARERYGRGRDEMVQAAIDGIRQY